MRPTDVLAIQRRMYERSVEWLRVHPAWSDLDEFKRRAVMALECTLYQDAPTYFVTAEMAAIAQVAAQSMPSQELKNGDWPSSKGFLIFEDGLAHVINTANGEPVKPGLVSGFAWSAHDGTDPDYRPDRAPGVSVVPIGHMSNAEYTTLLDVDKPVPRWAIGQAPQGERFQLAPLVLATWTIMQQKLALRETTPVERAERRRCERLDMPQNVVVVRVRPRDRAGDRGEESVPVDWSHRWVVSGHWRNQYLPSRDAHRQQWINSYVKGPDDKPLVVKDRVTAWVR